MFWCFLRVLLLKIDWFWILIMLWWVRCGLVKMRCREIWWINLKRLTMFFLIFLVLVLKFLVFSLSNCCWWWYYLVVWVLMCCCGNGIFCNAWYLAWSITSDRSRSREEWFAGLWLLILCVLLIMLLCMMKKMIFMLIECKFKIMFYFF